MPEYSCRVTLRTANPEVSFENVARIDFTWFSYCQNTSARLQSGGLWGRPGRQGRAREVWDCGLHQLVWSWVVSCNLQGYVSQCPRGGNSSRGLQSRGGGDGYRVSGLCVVRVCGLLGGLGLWWDPGVFCGRPLWLAGCGWLRVARRRAGRGGRPRVSGRGRGSQLRGRCDEPVWATEWRARREGRGMWGKVGVWRIGARGRSQLRSDVVSCQLFDMEFALYRGSG